MAGKRVSASTFAVSDALVQMREMDMTQSWKRDIDRAMIQLMMFTEAVPPSALTEDEFAFVTGLVGEVQVEADEQARGGRA